MQVNPGPEPMNEPLDIVQDALDRLREHRTSTLAVWVRGMLRLGAWLRYMERTGDRRLWRDDVPDAVVLAWLTPNERAMWRELGTLAEPTE